MLIKDLIKINTNAKFVNDVQLRWFWDAPRNAELTKSYIFTQQANDKQRSAVYALRMMRFGFTDPGSENRMLFIGTFGQGKTHLALALANLFGKPLASQEAQWLLESLKRADSSEALSFADWKENRPPHLVVCLQGDAGGFELASSLVRELERALANELSSSGGMLPLWYQTAINTLDASVAPQQVKADAYLAPHGMDLPSLRQRLAAEKDASLYDLVRGLIEHVTGVLPALGSRLALHDLVSYICDTYCGEGKPYSGLVVLFDEFNAFMQSYSKQNVVGTPLQDLLNGIANPKNQGKALFAGFAQRDPTQIVSAVQDPAKQADLQLELSRIPKGQRTQLFNNLETILDAYIAVDEDALRAEFEAAHAWPALGEAEEAMQALFKRRYDDELNWTLEQIRSKVTLGCFPLHPITTALLSSVELADTGAAAPRGILQFVLNEQAEVGERPVAVEGRPTWVPAIRMVDWFGSAICTEQTLWQQYIRAVMDGGGDLSEAEAKVLPAMLLHVIAGFAVRSVPYERAIALLAGLGEEEARKALAAMEGRNLIEKDASRSKYVFLSVSGGDRALREYINREVAQTAITKETIEEPLHSTETASAIGLSPIGIPVEWGNSQDWQAKPLLLPGEFFTVDTLQTLLKAGSPLSVWLVPRDEEEQQKLASTAQGIVDIACGPTPRPLVVFLPEDPLPGVLTSLRKRQVLENLPADQRREFAAYLDGTRKRANEQLEDQVRALRKSSKQWFAPSALTAVLQAQALQGDVLIKQVVLDCFKKAPPSFVQTQREDAIQLRRASALLGRLLLSNDAPDLAKRIEKQGKDGMLKVAETIVNTILTQNAGRPNAWGILSGSKHLQNPTHLRTQHAWDQINNAFPVGGPASDPKKVIDLLQQSPFGYRPNALTILMCSWIGLHRFDLEVTKAGALFPVPDLEKLLADDRTATFIKELGNGAYQIKLKDRSSVLQEIENTISRVKQISSTPLSRQEAIDALAKFDSYLSDAGNTDQIMGQRVEEAKDRVKADLGSADTYDAQAQDVLNKLESTRKVSDALDQLKKALALPAYSGVTPAKPLFKEIVNKAESKLEAIVEAECQRLSKLSTLTDYGRQEHDLKMFLNKLADKTQLQHKVNDALAKLQQACGDLEAKQSEAADMSKVDALSVHGPLVELEANLRKIDAMTGGSEKVQARRAEKRQELAGRIHAIITFADELDARIQSVASAKDLRNLEVDIHRNSGFLSGHVGEAKSKAAIERCAALGTFFTVVDSLRGKPMETPEGLTAILAECEDVRQHQGAGLSTAQTQVLTEVEAAKHQEAEAKRQAARGWLEAKQKSWDADAADPSAFLRGLERRPAFLPEDAVTALFGLQASAREKLEADEENWIVARFQGITDKARKEHLLNKLQKMLAE